MLFFLFIWISSSLDILTENIYLMKSNKIQNGWSPNYSGSSTCHPARGYYYKFTSLIFTPSLSEEDLQVTLSISSPLAISLSESFFTLNSSKEVLIVYPLRSNSGWYEVILNINTGANSQSASWMVYQGDQRSFFDLSLLILLVIALALVSYSAYSARNVSSLQFLAEDNNDVLTTHHAVGFVVVGSLFLVGLFFLMKYIGFVLEILVCIGGAGAVLSVIEEFNFNQYWPRSFDLPVLGSIQAVKLCAGLFTIFLIVFYELTKNWIISNLIGCCFAFVMIKTVKIPNFKVGSLLLGLAFFYDIFWVYFSSYIFGDNVMVAVASGLDLPIKLQWPHYVSDSVPQSCSMLGLGDLALPGLFLAFASRFDHINSTKYLKVLIGCYALALVLCMFVLVVFEYPQPALLYISPLLIFGMLIFAYNRGEVYKIWKGITVTPLNNYEFPLEDIRNK